jgi:hypothetical protein
MIAVKKRDLGDILSEQIEALEMKWKKTQQEI